jgi:hypothetical protein
MPRSASLGLTLIERVALEVVQEERPAILGALRERLTPVLDELARTCQGLVTTQIEAEDLLDRLRAEFVGRILAEMEPWGEEADLWEAVVGLLARQIITEATPGFVRRVVGAKWN